MAAGFPWPSWASLKLRLQEAGPNAWKTASWLHGRLQLNRNTVPPHAGPPSVGWSRDNRPSWASQEDVRC